MLEVLLITGKTPENYADGFGIFAGGGANNYIASTDKYNFVSGAMSPGLNLAAGRHTMASAGAETFGVFYGGRAGSTTAVGTVERHINADGTYVGETALETRHSHSGVTALTFGLFGGGYTGVNSIVTNTKLYAFDTLTSTPGTTLSTASSSVFNAAGIGDASAGIFATYTATRNSIKYTYASSVVTTAVNLTQNRAAASSTNAVGFGLIVGGINSGGTVQQSSTEKYFFASDTSAAASGMLDVRYQSAGAGNTAMGAFAGGAITASPFFVRTTYTYVYSDNTRAVGSNLGLIKAQLSPHSSVRASL